MTTLRHTLRHRLASPWWIGALAAAVLIGCGGGDGGSSSASNGVGTGGTGAAAGPVTGYGSLIVNNTRFDVDAATFTDDEGERVTIADRVRPVGLGAIVDIRSGEITRNSDDDDVGKATTVTVVVSIKGPVEVAPSGNSLKVLGQTVNVNSATQYGTANGVLSDLTVNTPVVVFGYQDATGAYLATRIEALSSPLQSYKLRGRVTSSSGSRYFRMGEVNGAGGITVDTVGLTLVTLPQVGSTVTVRLGTLPVAANVYRAVLPLNTVDRTPTEATRSGLEGIVSGYTPGSPSFKVDGVAVLTNSSTQITGTLDNNRRVSVEGKVVNRVLVATQVAVRADGGEDLASSYKLIDRVSSPVASAKTFQLKNLVVSYTDATRFDNGTAANLASLPVVLVEGYASGGGFVATRIRFR